MNRTQLFSFLPVILFVVFFTSCTRETIDSVSQDKIYATYELFYDKVRNVTEAKATFQFSNGLGTKLELKSPAEVKFNNDALGLEPLFADYKKEYPGLVTNGTFTFKDLNGKTYVNTISAVPTIDLPVNLQTISRNADYSLNWLGDPVGKGQAVGVGLSSASAISVYGFLQAVENSTSITLGSDKLKTIATTADGKVYCIMDRYAISSLQQGTSSGGQLKATYRVSRLITMQ
jgi:hypothetical protein